jgi:hypothetical protein
MSHPPTRSQAVSVLIDNFNYGRYLGAAIESALAQSYPIREVIVCDDGSTDDSCRVVERYTAQDSRVRLLRQPNQGQGSAFNTAFAASTGEIVCLLDSDDVWGPHKVARVVEAFSSSPEAGWVRHRMRCTDQALRPLPMSVPACHGSGRLEGDLYALLEKTLAFTTSAVALRRELAERVFPIPGTLYRLGPDLYIGYMCGLLGAVGCFLDHELGLYRRHSAQISACGGAYQAILETEIAMTRTFLAFEPCHGYVPTHVYKHEMIAAYMRSGRVLDLGRLRLCAAGLESVGLLARRGRTRLALLQLAKLAFGFLLPDFWIQRQLRLHGWSAA